MPAKEEAAFNDQEQRADWLGQGGCWRPLRGRNADVLLSFLTPYSSQERHFHSLCPGCLVSKTVPPTAGAAIVRTDDGLRGTNGGRVVGLFLGESITQERSGSFETWINSRGWLPPLRSSMFRER